jgi:hypothetical protein
MSVTRLITRLAPGAPGRTRHVLGMPPMAPGEPDTRTQMPAADLLVIEERPEGVFLFRYTSDGEFGGDTWHLSVAEARDQAAHEYGDRVGTWQALEGEGRIKDLMRGP